MAKKSMRIRPVAVVGFVISVSALLILVLYSLDPEVRRQLIAQYTPNLVWHLPVGARVASVAFMILNIPTVFVGELVLRTLLASSPPLVRMIGNIVIWWLLTPLWWWFVGTVGYRRSARERDIERNA